MRLPLGRFLQVAVDAAGALAELHEASGVHGALTPAWVVGDSATEPVEPFAYRSPEQTGRLNRSVDERSDLYVLGVILYELLTGQLPFEAADPLAWMHRHLAVPPRAPRELEPAIPEAVEVIVLRLLAKDPEDRYQTATGLRYDLERCLEQWRQERAIAPFALGERDRNGRLSIPERVYGRTRERRALLDAFAAVREGNGPRVVVVRGGAGVGKSALVRELAGPVAAAGGLLAAGKFDDSPQRMLYGPIARGVGDLVTLILAGPDRELADWRERLTRGVGDSARVLTDVVPRLELVLGSQPPVLPLPPAESHHRFANAFRRFIGVFATAEHPLALFLDDVHWADAASLRLLGHLASDRSLRSLLIVTACRRETPSTAALLDELRHDGIPVHTIELGPLGPRPLTHLLADALRAVPDACEPLQAVLREKTAGNPLFFTQLLVELSRAGLVAFDPDARRWRWDVDAIRRHTVSDNVVGLLTERLDGCSSEMQRTLSLAACVGGTFDVPLLTSIGAGSHDETAQAVEAAVRAGLVIRAADGYRFSHDRVREAAYAAIPAADEAPTHLRIGRALLAGGAEVVDAVAQLDRGRAAVQEQGERRELARLNLVAAERARDAAAFDAVSEYCAAGLELLGPDGWSTDHSLTFSLTLGQADAELFAGNVLVGERLLSAAIAQARSRHERTLCARLWIDLKTTAGALVEGLTYAFEVLRSYGLEITIPPGNVEEVECAMRTRLGDRWEATLLGLPRGEDPEIGGALDLMARAGPQGSIVDGRLFALLTCSIIDLTLTHGVYAASVWALTAYGYQLSSKGGHADADRLFDLALELADRHGFVAHRPAICTILSTRIWTRPLRAAVETAREGVRLGIEHGDVHNAAICSVLVCLDRLAAGEPLADIERDAEEGLEVARRVRLAGEAGNLVVIRQLVRALRGRTDGLSAFTGPGFDQRALEETLTANEPVGLSLWFYIYQLQAQVLAGEYTAALETRPRAQSLPEFMRGFPLAIAAELFGALAIAGSERDEREAHLRELRESAGRFAHWAELSHENFAHGHALLAGELARAEGRGSEALERFGVAAARAQASGFIHVEALAHESAARTCRELGRLGAAERHVHQAIECYRQWGAEGVAARLEQTLSGASSAGGAELVDALAVARAAQTIAREAQLERLIERLLETAIMQAGARGGALLLRRGDATVVAASAERTGDGVAVTIYAPPREPSAVLVAETVVNYVTRTKQPLILSDAASAEVFGSDPYILRRGVRSMLCVPMLARGELRGLLCVENDLIAGAFTSERLGALELITAQAVISLENAQARDHLRAMAARIVTAGDEARRRIERNLHDGTQQQLLVLGLDLQTLDTIIPAEAREAHAELARIRADAAAILDQVREISRGLHPAVLTHGGLGPALAALARASPIPVRLAVDCDVRLPAPVEICTYYVVSESLANAAKHSGAEVVTIDVRVADELLHAVVTDDGRGGADERSGSGITGLSDRVEALGGRLAISSPRGRGTRVAIELPIQPAD